MMDDAVFGSEGQADEPLDPAIRAAAAGYNEPPSVVPRDAMWQAIQAQRASGQPTLHSTARTDARRRSMWSWRQWSNPVLAAAASVLIALGISLGWWARGDRSAPRSVAGPGHGDAAVANDAAYRIAVTRDLSQAEAVLTAFRDDSRSKDTATDAQLAQWAREVLSNTQLLLDSPVGADPQRRQLLEDLELVLVQMTQPTASHSPTDREMINRTLDRDHVLPRIRAAVPAGSAGT